MLSRCQQVRPVTTRSRVVAWAIVALTLGSVNQCVSQDARGVAERSLRFTYKVTISGLSVDDQVRAWIPEPVEDPYQSVELVSRNLPGKQSQQRGRQYGNAISYFSATVRSAQDLKASLSWDIKRRASDPLTSTLQLPKVTEATKQQFLAANRLVPVNGKTLKALNVSGLPTDLIDRGEYLFDLVARHMRFFGKLSADRVAFTTGRDLILEPAQNGEPLNFFIYPHVEVNSQVWPRDRVVTEFTSTSK
jgi:hypothetical protein